MGTAFRRLLDQQAVSLFREDLDLSRTFDIANILGEVDPEAVVNCAAYTKVDQAEDEEELATTVNGTAVGILSEWCDLHRRPLLTFSTDYVFDGRADTPYLESSPTDPVNAYGRSKLVGEELAAGADALVVRTSWVISGSHPNFVATMLRLAGEGEHLRVVDDQIGCPTIAMDLAQTSYEALQLGATGLLHVTNQGPTSWYQLARASIETAGLDPAVITPCTTDEYPTRAKRPAYSVLASERLGELGIEPPPRWEASLPGVVEEITTWL